MKTLMIAVLCAACPMLAFSEPSNAVPSMRLHEHITLPGGNKYAQGFVQYTGLCERVTFCALSTDIGSAFPSQDLRLYEGIDGQYRCVLSLPMLLRKGYRCVGDGTVLRVYTIQNYRDYDGDAPKTDPILVIDLKKIAELNAEPPAGGDGKPAPQP